MSSTSRPMAHTSPDNSLLMVVDVQGRLSTLVEDSATMIARQRILIQGCRLLDVPIVWAEQLPDKLGPTTAELTEVLDGLSPHIKSSFGCCGDPGIHSALESFAEAGRSHILLCGIEAHVCVWQTARDLLHQGYSVDLITDGVSSRRSSDRQVGIERMLNAGAQPSSVEMALFDLMGDATHAKFRDVSRLLK